MVSKANLVQPSYNSLNWDVPLNSNFGIVSDSLGSITAVSVTVSNVILTSTQAQAMAIVVSGSMLSSFSLFLPAGVVGSWILVNQTTGGTLSVYIDNGSGSPAGGGIIPPFASPLTIFSDGTNVINAGDVTPPGQIISFGGTSAPLGYLPCDGAAYSRAGYARLFAAISTTWGAGNGSTTFNVPDLRGYFMRGAGTNSDGTVGTGVGSKQSDLVGTHSHTVTDPGHAHTINAYVNAPTGAGNIGFGSVLSPGTGLTMTSATTGVTVNNSGTGIGAETRPKNQGVLYCIKY